MSFRCIECKRTFFKTLLHLNALKTFKTRKIVFIFKNSIILSSETEIFSLSTLSDVENLSLFRLNSLKVSQLNSLKISQLNSLKISQLNSFKISQTSQAVNVNALISSELVIFVAKTAATFVT